ncbi:MAG: hypothetical protein CMK07_10770 [Ponticaulis sp.]|nr:hypothetical protein [Ponticaulis sp.]
MAGDLDLTPISAVYGTEVSPTQRLISKSEPPRTLDDADFSSPDASEDNRAALETAISERSNEPKGRLVIERDQDTGKFIQKMVDPETGDVIRQWPEEQFIELAKQMGEAYGLMIDVNV